MLYGLLTKCEVKMAGYWPSSFLLFMDRDEVEVHKLAKKEWSQYPAILTKQTWSIKDLLFGFQGNFSCRIQRVVPRWLHLAHSRSQSHCMIWFILPARGAGHIIRIYYYSYRTLRLAETKLQTWKSFPISSVPKRDSDKRKQHQIEKFVPKALGLCKNVDALNVPYVESQRYIPYNFSANPKNFGFIIRNWILFHFPCKHKQYWNDKLTQLPPKHITMNQNNHYYN